jgi:HNH endonuclease
MVAGRERECATCRRQFVGAHRNCPDCRGTERTCPGCGRQFRGTARHCSVCQAIERTCPGCGRQFRSRYVRCLACRVSEGTCQGCGRTFIDVPGRARCPECRATERTCPGCGQTFTGLRARCQACRRSQRTCAMCGREHFSASTLCTACWRKSLPPPVQAAFIRRANNARRARKLAARVSGPVSREVYQAIARSGPCVYCGDHADTVDHVRPLTRGGDEHASNLVPCCARCNFSKGPRLLTEWEPARVAYAAERSPIVATELARLLADEFPDTVGFNSRGPA